MRGDPDKAVGEGLFGVFEVFEGIDMDGAGFRNDVHQGIAVAPVDGFLYELCAPEIEAGVDSVNAWKVLAAGVGASLGDEVLHVAILFDNAVPDRIEFGFGDTYDAVGGGVGFEVFDCFGNIVGGSTGAGGVEEEDALEFGLIVVGGGLESVLDDGPHCAGVLGEIIGAHEWDVGTHMFCDSGDGFTVGRANDFADFGGAKGAFDRVSDEGEVSELADVFSGETLAAASGGDDGEDGVDGAHKFTGLPVALDNRTAWMTWRALSPSSAVARGAGSWPWMARMKASSWRVYMASRGSGRRIVFCGSPSKVICFPIRSATVLLVG